MRLDRLERKIRRAALRWCNSGVSEARILSTQAKHRREVLVELGLAEADWLEINYDPRGYALKAKPGTKQAAACNERDWGGYGILCKGWEGEL